MLKPRWSLAPIKCTRSDWGEEKKGGGGGGEEEEGRKMKEAEQQKGKWSVGTENAGRKWINKACKPHS